MPVNPTWTTAAGGLTDGVLDGAGIRRDWWEDGAGNAYYNAEEFVAPSNAANVTIIATVAGQTLKTKFKVFEPTGENHAVVTLVTNFMHIDDVIGDVYFQTNKAGVIMQLKVFIGPTNVSFYNVQIMEVGEDASSIQGYFTNTYFTSDLLEHSTADFWFPIEDATNSWTDTCWNPISPQFGSPPQWSSGSFTWVIPAKWRVGFDTVTNSMAGWNEVFTNNVNGTVKITKMPDLKWGQRTTNNVITHN